MDVIDELRQLIKAEEHSRDHGVPEMVLAMRHAAEEIERLRAEIAKMRREHPHNINTDV